MADERNFIEQSRTMGALVDGREVTPADMARDFAKLDLMDRALRLNQLNADLDATEMSISEASRHAEYESALRKTHEVLRKAGR